MKPQERLERLIQSGRIPHALLFVGPQGADMEGAALQFAAGLLQTTKKPENHPDIHTYCPEGKVGMHPIESIRKLSSAVSLVPYEGNWKIFILHEADKMLPTSSNALLKTLEEPTENTVIILITHHPANLLPTIRSRCQVIDFPAQTTLSVDEGILSILSETERNFSTFESEQPDRVFETILLWYRDRLVLEMGGCDQYLHFPGHIESLKKTAFIPLELVEKSISLARLAHSRSTKLSTCLEMLFLSFK